MLFKVLGAFKEITDKFFSKEVALAIAAFFGKFIGLHVNPSWSVRNYNTIGHSILTSLKDNIKAIWHRLFSADDEEVLTQVTVYV